MSPSRVPNLIRSRRTRLLALGAAALLAPAVATAPASAASALVLKVADPTGDAVGGAGLDITGATIAQNTSTGGVSATVNFAAAPPMGMTFALALGKLSGTECAYSDEGSGALAFLVAIDSATPTGTWVKDGDTAFHPMTPKLSGSTLTVDSGSAAALKTLSWNCAVIKVAMPGATENDVLGDAATGSGPVAGSTQIVVLTDKPDADKDGVPDVADACPKVAGSTANGCLVIAAKKSLRLGAKRLVIDKMVKRTGSTCKATAKVTVTQKVGRKNKTIGKGTLDVGVHGSYCHVAGIVKIKKHGKKVKVTVKGSGFKAFRANVKK